MLPSPKLAVPASNRFVCGLLALACALPGFSAETRTPDDIAASKPTATAQAVDEAADSGEITSLAAYNVKADRIEDFGLRVESETYSGKQANLATLWFSTFVPRISAVIPNTAAAKAGLQPGERILKSEGQSTVGGPFSTGKFGQWHKTQKRKWAEVAEGKKNVTWTLEVESPLTKAVRTVKLVVPTPPPQWGSAVWRPPEGRRPSIVTETGPLAERSRAVLDNGIWTMVAPGLVGASALETLFGQKIPPDSAPNGYTWHLDGGSAGSHRFIVTQFRGRTDILLQAGSNLSGYRFYLTSPSGVLEKAWQWRRGKAVELSAADARVGFEHEVDLWSTKVGKVSPRWPFEVKPGVDPNAIFAVLAPKRDASAATPAVPALAAEFLKLPVATAAQSALFTEAYGKLGTETEHWAYTETARGIEDRRVFVTRVHPSLTAAERSTLLSIDGQPPTPEEVQRWRDDGGDTPKALGELPPLAGLIDLRDLRVVQEDAAAVVFEVPLRRDNAEFPAEKFQALFRVNKTSRGFERIAVKLRDTFRVGGVVNVTEAGLEMRFQTLDPALAPQPVWLKAGGGVRVLLVKFSRSFEATRGDFKRVLPSADAVAPVK